MTEPIISVRGLSKQYRIGARRDRYRTFRESLARAVGNSLRLLTREGRAAGISDDLFWALHDVSFDVQQGEVIGVIGRNGAGKSTLLKILCGITAPTEGRAEIRGRVASLLEVGTGFHPELTGRENIFLNGAILGMSRAEIRRKFDEIVAFAEVEKFIDTPVKRYSSGMYVRLAFAVAAHLEPEILLIDEVLAVGDIAFQRKCLGKMGSVARSGRTILFVSHNMGAIREICPRCIWIDQGRLRQFDASSAVVQSYSRECDASGGSAESVFAEDPRKPFQVRRAGTVGNDGQPTQSFTCDEPIVMHFTCEVRATVPGLYGYLSVYRSDGTEVMVSDSFDTNPNPLDNLNTGIQRLAITIPARTLGPGDYYAAANFTSIQNQQGFSVDSPGIVCRFHLDDFNTRRGNRRQGYFSTRMNWLVTPAPAQES